MSGLLFALLAVFLAGIGARDQLLVAGLTARQGMRPAVLIVAVLTALASAAAVAWLGGAMLAEMRPVQRHFFAALVLGVAGIEMVAIGRPRLPEEPTHSLFAFGIVLLAQQITDAARFLVLAIAIATAAAVPAGVGGMLGGAATVALGWAGGEHLLGRNLALPRRLIGLILLGVAGWMALNAR